MAQKVPEDFKELFGKYNADNCYAVKVALFCVMLSVTLKWTLLGRCQVAQHQGYGSYYYRQRLVRDVVVTCCAALQGYIYSSLVGFLQLVKKTKDGQETVSIEVHTPNEETTVPALGDIVTARVVSVNPRFAKVLIECVREITLNEPFRAQIRKEDIREFEKDKIEMFKSFRPGDVILARVLSFGEASSGYLLSTAENELGVVIAKSEQSGVNMIPVSWTEMQCPKTYNKELRKIAKVIPENLAAKPENL